MRLGSRALLGWLVLGWAALWAVDVAAHGDPPAGQSVHAVDGEWVYVTNFGVMAPGWADEYVCEEAFFGSVRFRVVPLTESRWATFTRTTASVTDDGCDFDLVMQIPAAPTDVAHLSGTEEVAFTVQRDGEAEVWHSTTGGEEWSQVPVTLEGVRPAGLGFLESRRLVLVGYVTDEEDRGAPVITEIDVGTGVREDHEVDQGLRFPDLLDAQGGDFLWHGRRAEGHEIYWSQGGELTAGGLMSERWPSAGAISPDGSAAYLGGVDPENRGVFRAVRGEPDVWEEIAPGHRVLCLGADDGGVFVCGHRNHDGYDLMRWTEADGVEVLVDFRDMTGFRSDCPPTSNTAAICPAVWPETARALSIDAAPVEPDLPGAGEEGPEDEEGDGCGGCGAVPGGSPGAWILFLVVLLMMRRETMRPKRRKRRKRRWSTR